MKRSAVLALSLLVSVCAAFAAAVRGTVIDKETREPVFRATIKVEGTSVAGATDLNGKFELAGLRNGHYVLAVSCISYVAQMVEVDVDGLTEVTVEMVADDKLLGEVKVSAFQLKNTDAALLSMQRSSLVAQTSISSQTIARMQDKNASEVIRRVPGISIIEDKFVMVRGLSQRYNNVWINNSAVPSSEADSRAFSFDLIPSSQMDNMIVVKAAAPEYPADFSGGFILINTKDVPNENAFSVSVGGSVNDRTHFHDILSGKGSATDFLGFDNGLRGLDGGIHAELKPLNNGVDLTGNGLNNDWTVRSRKPVADLSLNVNLARKRVTGRGATWAILGSLNYGNAYKAYTGMDNNLFGVYDLTHDCSNYLRRSTDDQYNREARLGVMLNLTYVPVRGNSRYEFKNIFNQLGKDRYTYRKGTNAQSEYEESAEYYYQSRTTYNGQFTGKHTLTDRDKMDWSAGYSYANRNMPDRRRYTVTDEGMNGERDMQVENLNDINREFTQLDEHIMSANANYQHQFEFARISPLLKAGAYAEYRTRKYDTRFFLYNWPGGLPVDYRRMDVPGELLQEQNYGADKLYLLEKVDWSNNYEGNNTLAAGYVGMNLPFGRWNAYAGVRFEHDRMELVSHTRRAARSPKSRFYTYDDFFPSLNLAYKLDDRHQFRLSYGRTVNRPEFREVSSSVFYDFELASNVQGNVDLKPSYINNVDFEYEFYPSAGELISVSLFYKHFVDPIEWTYTVAGGTDLVFSYLNAEGANNYGIEVDIRKKLDFIGLRGLYLSLNGALIKSRVTFPEGTNNKNRPMQGQSPYLLNAGLFYSHPTAGWDVSLLYNRIGKRIIGVGRSLGTAADDVRVPDSYEMPRNTVDFNISKKFFGRLEVKASVRNLLGEAVRFEQFDEDASGGEVVQVTRRYKPGRNFNLSIGYDF